MWKTFVLLKIVIPPHEMDGGRLGSVLIKGDVKNLDPQKA